MTLAEPVLDLFQRYHWPGNFRQLHNLLRTAVVMVGGQGEIGLEHLPDDFLDEIGNRQPSTLPPAAPAPAASASPVPDVAGAATPLSEPAGPEGTRLEDVALSAMAHMLRVHKGNVSAAAKALGVSRNTIYRKKGLLPPDLL